MIRQHLVIDADDTLWENNIYFEAAFTRFCELLNHSTLTPDEVRAALDAIELENIKVHGYGAVNFARNLRQCLGHLAEREVSDKEMTQAEQLALDILRHPIELLPGVRETLEHLAGRHELTIFTKGSEAEQQAKIDRSGLAPFFDHVAIVKEKHREAYQSLAERNRLHLPDAWMVGNSPKSDINPALAAGWNAAFIPHPRTWGLEREELRSPGPGRLLHLARFSDLLQFF